MNLDPARRACDVERANPQAELVGLIDEHAAALYRYAYRLAGTAADAEDLTQQVFLIALDKLDQVRSAAAARGWLFTVLRNCYLKSKRRPPPLTAVGLGLDLDSLPADEDESEIDQELLQLAINELPDEFKLAVLLFYFEDRTYREIAEQLKVPIGTVMSRLARGKAHLRQRLLTSNSLAEPPTRDSKAKISRIISSQH
jgi:RNA polymerase sigma-70 factor (ECF subfamily)